MSDLQKVLTQIRFAQAKTAYSKYIRHLEKSDAKKAPIFREQLRRATGLSAPQLSRFENSQQIYRDKHKKFIHDLVIGFLLSTKISVKAQFITNSNQSESSRWIVEYLNEQVVEPLNEQWNALISFSSSLSDKSISARFAVEAKRALFHVAAQKFVSNDSSTERMDQFFRSHSGGYRFISRSSGTKDQDVNVSGLYIEPSPYAPISMFQEAFRNITDNSTLRYRGICFSHGSPDALYHYFLSFFEGRVQLAITRSEIRRTTWLEGVRLSYDAQSGPLAIPIAGVLLGKTFDCFNNRGVKSENEYLNDPPAIFAEELLQRLQNIEKRLAR